MSTKIISILNIVLILLLCSSIYLSVRINLADLRIGAKLISTQELKLMKDKLRMPTAIKADYAFKNKLYTKAPIDIKKNIFLDTSQTKQESRDSLTQDGPETNLPVFLTKSAESLSIVAISKHSNNSRVIITDNSSNKSYILEEGDSFKDFLVIKIEEDLVILSKDEEEYRLDFTEKMRRL